MAYLMLAAAIVAEVAATTLLPRTDGFTRWAPSALVLLGYAVSFVLLAYVVKTVPVGIAYAIWSAVGTVAVVAIGAVLLGQRITGWQAAGVGLVVVGVVLLNLGGATESVS